MQDSTSVNGEATAPTLEEARNLAAKSAKDRAEQYALLTGRKLGRAISISEGEATEATEGTQARAVVSATYELR